MMQYSYYPGCSLKGTGRAYEESVLAVFQALGVELNEIEDWNCCGATAYMSIDESKALALAARNLALAEKMGGDDVVAPCSGCFLVLNKTHHYMEEYPEVGRKARGTLKANGLTYSGVVNVRHPLDVIVNDIGLDVLKGKVTRPLKGLKVAPYYGCQIVRPYAPFDHQIHPTSMDRLLEALGATVVHYPLKTKCCGGSLTGTMPDVGLKLAYILLNEAKKREADLVATVCPLCHFNLDSYQDTIAGEFGPTDMPVVYFTQLIGVALGLSDEQLGLRRNIVRADAAMGKLEPAGIG